MNIELFLRTITQEYSDGQTTGVLDRNRLYETGRDNWGGEWRGQNWNYQKALTGELKDGHSRIKDLLIREEAFGALLYDPVSTAVFKTDKDGLKVINYLQKGMDLNEISKVTGFCNDTDNLGFFVNKLKEYKIW